MKVHRFTVDSYAAQHPGKPGRRESKSVVGHLVALYLMLERKWEPAAVTRVMGRLIERHRHRFEWLDPPADLGRMTVLDLHGAKTPKEHERIAKAWAQSVWTTWAGRHRDTIASYAEMLPEIIPDLIHSQNRRRG